MKADPTLQQKIFQYQVVGRKQPTEAEPTPSLFRMRLFARNKVLAVSKFWYLLKKMKKVKKSTGEILAVNEIREKRATFVKNFGVWLRYDSRTGTHNMYKEVRDISQNGAVSQLYAEMAGRHRALPSNIQIIRVAEIKASQCRRPHMQQMFDSKLKLPAIRRIFPTPKDKKSVFCARKPTLFLQ
ncbi:LOC549444 protein, related [Neospora caninum Liverpool]|uniref:60S ribosomal protein L18a n=1 Tax=Neospora caninum (strain Liverpool) TaxID=572307 RepID=F0VG87_NEOCL|nr:LOC549444 protein, related [Neospora caninum Liverpool]CBZ52731.1 LOC549444 protein, related [Neospora caninum Liverpool]CEL66712.1 TPA: LOC549444 protein, related [Neospora caninum Liverpool]|eukprot:XP_003882763.1 LOC549444 protein, related [Neospora caninum Liverpool]